MQRALEVSDIAIGEILVNRGHAPRSARDALGPNGWAPSSRPSPPSEQHSPGARPARAGTLLTLDRAIRALARRFGLTPKDLKLDLGPLGRLT
jgi:hypothetical protein